MQFQVATKTTKPPITLISNEEEDSNEFLRIESMKCHPSIDFLKLSKRFKFIWPISVSS